MREQADAAHDVELGVVSGDPLQGPEEPAKSSGVPGLQRCDATEAGRRAAVHDYGVTAGKEQVRELSVSSADVEHVERSAAGPVEERRYRSGLMLQKERTHLPREPRCVLIRRGNDIGPERVVRGCLARMRERYRNSFRM